jgi:hypothetical protein
MTSERDLLALRDIVEGMFKLANGRARRDGSYRQEDDVRERDLDDRLLRLHEKLLEDLRTNIMSGVAKWHLQNAVPIGNA